MREASACLIYYDRYRIRDFSQKISSRSHTLYRSVLHRYTLSWKNNVIDLYFAKFRLHLNYSYNFSDRSHKITDIYTLKSFKQVHRFSSFPVFNVYGTKHYSRVYTAFHIKHFGVKQVNKTAVKTDRSEGDLYKKYFFAGTFLSGKEKKLTSSTGIKINRFKKTGLIGFYSGKDFNTPQKALYKNYIKNHTYLFLTFPAYRDLKSYFHNAHIRNLTGAEYIYTRIPEPFAYNKQTVYSENKTSKIIKLKSGKKTVFSNFHSASERIITNLIQKNKNLIFHRSVKNRDFYHKTEKKDIAEKIRKEVEKIRLETSYSSHKEHTDLKDRTNQVNYFSTKEVVERISEHVYEEISKKLKKDLIRRGLADV